MKVTPSRLSAITHISHINSEERTVISNICTRYSRIAEHSGVTSRQVV